MAITYREAAFGKSNHRKIANRAATAAWNAAALRIGSARSLSKINETAQRSATILGDSLERRKRDEERAFQLKIRQNEAGEREKERQEQLQRSLTIQSQQIGFQQGEGAANRAASAAAQANQLNFQRGEGAANRAASAAAQDKQIQSNSKLQAQAAAEAASKVKDAREAALKFRKQR